MSEKTIPQRKTNARRIALDKLEPGNPADAGKRLPRALALPERVSSRELYGDIVAIAWPSLMELLLT